MVKRSVAFAQVVAVVAIACDREPSSSPSASAVAGVRIARIDDSLARAGVTLAARQGPDGGFHSRSYGLLRDGQAVTPLVALALRKTPATTAYQWAVPFIARVARESQHSDPLYSCALGALVLGAPENRERYRGEHRQLIACVRALQHAEANGWPADDPSYGGWGYALFAPTYRQSSDDMMASNLSATLLAIGALALGGTAHDDPALVAAARFVTRSQRADDGGFFFSPALDDPNKAGRDDRGPRSYGTMTADGVRALLRLGRPLDDHQVVHALAWFDRNFDAARNPGAFPPAAELRRASAYYYWVWSAAHVIDHARGGRRELAARLADELLARQRPDGSWINDATEMREDDPLIATSFAVAALALCRGVLVDEFPSHATTEPRVEKAGRDQ